MFMVLSSWQSHCESSPGSFDECGTAPSGRRPMTKPDDLGCESACTGCQNLHPPSPFIIIIQPESWYTFYRPTEGRRLSRPSWDGLPVHRRSPILVLIGSDVAQLYADRGQRVTIRYQNRSGIARAFIPISGVSTKYERLIRYRKRRLNGFTGGVYQTSIHAQRRYVHPLTAPRFKSSCYLIPTPTLLLYQYLLPVIRRNCLFCLGHT